LTKNSIELWQPFKVSPRLTFGQSSKITSIVAYPSSSDPNLNKLATATVDGRISVFRPHCDSSNKAFNQHKSAMIATKFLPFADSELMISGGKDGTIHIHNHNQGSIEKYFETKLSGKDPIHLLSMDVFPISEVALAISFAFRQQNAGPNSSFGVLMLRKIDGEKFTTALFVNPSISVNTLLAKFYKTDEELILVAAVSSPADECAMNFYSFPLSTLEGQWSKKGKSLKQKPPKFKLQHACPLNDWPLDFEWLANAVTVKFCNIPSEIIHVGWKTIETTETRAVSDFGRELIFINSPENLNSNQVGGLDADITAYDVMDDLISIATANHDIQLWRGGKMIGKIQVDANVTCLAFSKASVAKTAAATRMKYIAIGSCNGELMLLRWVWSEDTQ